MSSVCVDLWPRWSDEYFRLIAMTTRCFNRRLGVHPEHSRIGDTVGQPSIKDCCFSFTYRLVFVDRPLDETLHKQLGPIVERRFTGDRSVFGESAPVQARPPQLLMGREQ